MDKQDYLTISQVAKKVGVSYQAIYKRLNSTLKDYVLTVENRKVLKKEVLREFEDSEISTVKNKNLNVQKNNSTVENYQNGKSADNEEIKRINQRNEDIIDDLRAQIKEKDEQIKQQSEHIIELSSKITELFENNQKLQLNYQMLLSTEDNIKDIIEVDVEGARSNEEVINTNTDVAENEEGAPPKEKESLLKRLFKGRK